MCLALQSKSCRGIAHASGSLVLNQPTPAWLQPYQVLVAAVVSEDRQGTALQT